MRASKQFKIYFTSLIAMAASLTIGLTTNASVESTANDASEMVLNNLFFADSRFQATQQSSPVAPACLSKGTAIPIDDQQVIDWKAGTPNQFRSRGHVLGKIEQLFASKTGHNHFLIRIGQNAQDILEVVYNDTFGALGELKIGSEVEACGDYITSNQPAGHFPASPAGAIIHWVHRSTGRQHESGFLIIDGVLFGQN
jgi:hypothetical protein